MSMENQSAYILEGRELTVLLMAKGISGFLGFPLQNIPKTREEAFKILFTLTEKGFLISDGKDFQAEKGIAECVEILEHMKGVLIMNPRQEEVPPSFIYPHEQVLICQPTFKQDTLKMWKTDWENLEELV